MPVILALIWIAVGAFAGTLITAAVWHRRCERMNDGWYKHSMAQSQSWEKT